jgi:hypothetical protein
MMKAGDVNATDGASFDPESELPAGKAWFSPRWLARHWGRSIQHVLNLIESGEIRDNVDMRGEGSRRSNLNIPRQAVIDFLKRRKNQ